MCSLSVTSNPPLGMKVAIKEKGRKMPKHDGTKMTCVPTLNLVLPPVSHLWVSVSFATRSGVHRVICTLKRQAICDRKKKIHKIETNKISHRKTIKLAGYLFHMAVEIY